MTKSVFRSNRRPFQEDQERLGEVINWLSSHGKEPIGTRIAMYQKDLGRLVKAYSEGKLDELLNKRDAETLLNSFLEARSLVLIHKGLKLIQGQDNALGQRIKDLLKGPEHSNQESSKTSSNQARNVSFELVVAAYFAIAGYKIDLSTDADLSIEDVNTMLFVECKRPQSENGIEPNINDALKQLTRRYEESNFNGEKRGLLALSISKIVNPEQRLLVAKDDQDLHTKMSNILEKFIRKYEYLWAKPKDARTLGIIVHLHTPAEVEGEDSYFTARNTGFSSITVEGTPDDNYFCEIAGKLQKAL